MRAISFDDIGVNQDDATEIVHALVHAGADVAAIDPGGRNLVQIVERQQSINDKTRALLLQILRKL